MNVSLTLFRDIFVAFALMLLPVIASAEGTKQLSPTEADECMIDIDPFADFGTIDRMLNIRISDTSERVYIGLSHIANGTGDLQATTLYQIQIVDPSGTVVYGPFTIGSGGGLTPNANTWLAASSGPDTLGSPDGYDTDLSTFPYACFNPDTIGDFSIEFNLLGVPTNSFLKWYDFTVVDSMDVEQTGRLWSFAWSFRTPRIELSLPFCGFDRPFNGSLFSYTKSGFVSKIDFAGSGFRGFDFIVAFGMDGPGNSGDILEDRKSVEGGDQTLEAADHMVFIAEPDITEFPSPPGDDACGEAEILGLECVADEFCIITGVTRVGQIEILLDFTGNGEYDENTADVLLAVMFDEPDTVCLDWDGLRGDNTPVQPGETVPAILRYAQGVQHYAAFDVEVLEAGFCVETVRPLCPGSNSPLLYWDDSDITAGSNDVNTPGTGQPKVQLDGCTCRTDSCRTWTNFQLGEGLACTGVPSGYGDENTLNTWWFANITIADPFTLSVLVASIAGDTVYCPGDSVELTASAEPTSSNLTFAWSGPNAFSATAASTGMIGDAGTYTVTITDTVNNCVVVDSQVIAEFTPPLITLEANCPTPNVQTGDVVVTATGEAPFTFEWSTGSINDTIFGVAPDTYSVTVTDANGCMTIDSIELMACCTLTFSCPPSNNTIYACLDDIPEADTTPILNLITEFCDRVTIDPSDLVMGGNGCSNDTLYLSRSYDILDGAGNTGLCVQLFKVVDSLAPEIVGICPPDTSLVCVASIDTSLLGVPVYRDACDGVIMTFRDDSSGFNGSCNNNEIGVIERTFFATDSCGNVDSMCVQTITIIDTIPPVVDMGSCPVDATVDCEASITPTDLGEPIYSDACAQPVAIAFTDDTVSGFDGTCSANVLGVIQRTFFGEDICGNVDSSCVQNITITDNTAPTFTLPNDTTADCGDAASVVPELTGFPTDTVDNCTEGLTVSFRDSIELDGCPAIDTIFRIWTVSDICGNEAAGMQTIVRVDREPPTFTPPADTVVACDADTASSALGGPTNVMDNCSTVPSITYVDVSNAGPCEGLDTIMRTWTLRDACGNDTTYIQRITMIDTVGPTFTVPADTSIACDEDALSTNLGIPTNVADNCATVLVFTERDSIVPDGCPAQDTLFRIWTVTDPCGNATTQIQTITRVDTVVPTFTLPPDVTVECAIDSLIDPESSGYPTDTMDNCTVGLTVTMRDSIELDGCPSSDTIFRIWTVEDICMNSASGIQTIVRIDMRPPTFTAPADTTISCEASTDTIGLGAPTDIMDNCSMVEDPTFVDNVVAGPCTGTDTIIRTWTITDECMNDTSYIQRITRVDTSGPTFTVPGDVTVGCMESIDTVDIGNVTDISDLCTNVTVTFSDMATGTGECPAVDTIFRIWTAADSCGNLTVQVQTIVVEDMEPPTVTCSVMDTTIDCATPIDTFGLPTFFDLCGAVTITFMDDTASGLSTPGEGGTIVRTFIGTDECGNTNSSCTQQITIQDTVPPVMVCPPAITVECPLSADTSITGIAAGTDNCTPDSLLVLTFSDVMDIDSLCPAGTVTRTFMLTDVENNTGQCEQVITVADDIAPTFTPPADITVLCGTDILDLSITGLVIDVMDCNGILDTTFADSEMNPACGTTIQRIWTVTDICGNSAEAIQRITILPEPNVDNLICNNLLRISLDQSCEALITADMIIDGSPADIEMFIVQVEGFGQAEGALLVSNPPLGVALKVTIISPTGKFCWGYVIFEDKLPPVIDCIVQQLECGDPTDAELYQPDAVDSCGGEVELTYTESTSGDECALIIISRIWTATDESGNSATCEQIITITPLDLATLVFPENYIGSCATPAFPSITGYPTVDGEPVVNGGVCNIFTTYEDQTLDDCGGGRKILRRWSILDWCTQEIRDTLQIIKLSDDAAPVIVDPADITIGVDPWECKGETELTTPIVADLCGSEWEVYPYSASEELEYVGGQWRISGLDLGSHEVIWIATDECGNSSTQAMQIEVIDEIPPVAICDENTVVALTTDDLYEQGLVKVEAEVFNDGSYDDCGEVTFEVRRMNSCINFDWTTAGAGFDEDPNSIVGSEDQGLLFGPKVPFACCDIGNDDLMVVLLVTDEAGNSNSCMVNVEVQDKQDPIVESLPDIKVSCDFSFEYKATDDFVPQDEDPLSTVFGKVLSSFEYDESERREIEILDLGNDQYDQPHVWGLDGWATDNCSVEIYVQVDVSEDCLGNDFGSSAPEGAVKRIQRLFEARDDFGNTTLTIQTIWVVDFGPFYISDTDCSNQDNNDGVIWPCDQNITGCPEEIVIDEPVVIEDNCNLIGVTYEDDVFQFVDGACQKILRTWTVIDWCQFDGEEHEGIWHYTQVIKIIDDNGPEFDFIEPLTTLDQITLCIDDPNVELPANNRVFVGEDGTNCSAHLTMSHPVVELCSDYVTYDVKIYPNDGSEFFVATERTTVEVDSATGMTMLHMDTRNAAPADIRANGLPYNEAFCTPEIGGQKDYHRLLWTVEDGCGIVSTLEYLLRLEDCKQPSPLCVNLYTVVMPSSGEITLWAADFNKSSYDDCTDEDDLLFSFMRDQYQPDKKIDCDTLDNNGSMTFFVDIWVADGGNDVDCDGVITWDERNKDFCSTIVVVEDNEGRCRSAFPISGTIETEEYDRVSDVTVNLMDMNGNEITNYTTTSSGEFKFINPVFSYIVKPERDDNDLNGVSTLDLVRIQQHLLGVLPFESPYKMIAADANNSESISATDLLEIRKLILGQYLEFPRNSSWRFVDRDFEFENVYRPWPFDERIESNVQSQDEDFVAIKIGDVNGTVAANADGEKVKVRSSSAPSLVLSTVDRAVRIGEQVEVVFHADNFAAVYGFQGTLVNKGLRAIRAGDQTEIGFTDSNLGLHQGVTTLSWHSGSPVTEEGALFSIVFEALRPGNLAQMLELNSIRTVAEVYFGVQDDMQTGDMVLVFDEEAVDNSVHFQLYQNTPNPFGEYTVVSFSLPQEAHATLTVFDMTGKVIHEVTGEYQKGLNEVQMHRQDFAVLGVLYYRLDTEGFSGTKKMILLD